MEILLLIVVIILVLVSNSRTSLLRSQIESLEQTIRALAERIATFSAPPAAATAGAAGVEPETEFPSTQAAATPPDITRSEYVAEPIPPASAPEPAVTSPETVPSEQPAASNIEEIPERFRDQDAAPAQASADNADQPQTKTAEAPAQPESSRPDFSDLEKRFGTQWVVWVGGVALALGGILLVRYSIEQGLFGPGLRVIAGAVLALVAGRARRTGAAQGKRLRHRRRCRARTSRAS